MDRHGNVSFGYFHFAPMNVIFLLIAASSLVAGVFLVGFLWAVKSGQYDDDRSPAVRMLAENEFRTTPSETK